MDICDIKSGKTSFSGFAWGINNKDELHSEYGFLAIKPSSNQVALTTVMNNGFTTVEEGEAAGNRVKLRLQDIGRITFSRDLPVHDIFSGMRRKQVLLKRLAFGLSFLCFLLFMLLYQTVQFTQQVNLRQQMELPSWERKDPDNIAFQQIHEITQKVIIDMEELFDEKFLDWDSCPRWFQLGSAYKKCLMHELSHAWQHYDHIRLRAPKEKLWHFFHKAMEICGANLLKRALHVKYLVNSDDIKILILPTSDKDNCTSVTIGIGNDTKAERRLKEYAPNTKFFGADPIFESGEIFEQIGKYFQVAVSGQGGQYNASVLKNGNYTWQIVPTLTLYDFLGETLSLRFVDFLLLDVEGAEYSILPQFTENGPFARKNLTVCQINVELHGPLTKYGTDEIRFSRVLKNFLLQSPYIPLWGHKPLTHQPVFFLNWRDPYCVKKFWNYWC